MQSLHYKVLLTGCFFLSLGIMTSNADRFSFEQKGKYGYQDEAGNTIIKAQFETAYPFNEGMAKVQKGNKWGYINEQGTYIIKPEYNEFGDFDENGVALVKKDNKYGYIRKDGTFLIKPEYDFIGSYNDQDYCWVAKGKTLESSLKGLFKGNVMIVQPKYQYLGFYNKTDSIDYSDGHVVAANINNEIKSNLCKLSPSDIDYIWITKTFNNQGLLDKDGKEIIKPSGYYIGAPKDNMVLMARYTKSHTYYNFCDISDGKAKKLFKKDTYKKNEEDAKVHAFHPFNKGKALIQEGTSFYIIDTKGNKVSDAYSNIQPLNNEGYIVAQNDRFGVLDHNCNLLVPIQYLKIWAPGDEENIMGVQDPETKKCGFINHKGDIIVPFQYEAANNFKFGRGYVKSENGWGMVDKNNRQLIKCNYADINILNTPDAELIWVKHKDDNKWRCRQISNDSQAFDAAFHNAWNFNQDNLAYVMTTEGTEDNQISRYGLIDHTGNLIIPVNFKSHKDVDKAHEYMKSQGKSVMLPIEAHRFNLYINPLSNKVKLSDKLDESKWDF